MVYLIIASVACAIQAGRQGGTTNSVMIFSILLTYGCEFFIATKSNHCKYLTSISVYAFSSLLAFDPWHMITSFIPYMLLSPMYINVLNM